MYAHLLNEFSDIFNFVHRIEFTENSPLNGMPADISFLNWKTYTYLMSQRIEISVRY